MSQIFEVSVGSTKTYKYKIHYAYTTATCELSKKNRLLAAMTAALEMIINTITQVEIDPGAYAAQNRLTYVYIDI